MTPHLPFKAVIDSLRPELEQDFTAIFPLMDTQCKSALSTNLPFKKERKGKKCRKGYKEKKKKRRI